MLLLRMIAAAFLLLFSGVGIYILATFFFRFFVWQGDEPLYRIAMALQQNLLLITFLYYAIGFVTIALHYWFKPFRYFQALIDAAEIVNRQDDSLVELPPQLSGLEGQLNQIKLDAMRSRRAAKEAEQRKNDLVTYLAHDLKTPITSVIGYLTLLRDEPQISEQTRLHYMDIAIDKAERLDDLINEFFDITRFNLSHISLEKRQINLSLMLEQLIYEFQPMLDVKQLSIDLQADPQLLLRCDPDKLQRVFDNLLRNAVNYSFENSSIRIRAKLAKKQICLTFENDGDTISEEKLSRLFEQFYRLDTSRSSKSGGAGLGLAIAKEIVELHGGTITAFSQNDVIRFDVALPM